MGNKRNYSREKRIREGMCIDCGGMPPSVGRKRCIFCSMSQTRRSVDRQNKFVSENKCRECGKVPPRLGRKKCGKCQVRGNGASSSSRRSALSASLKAVHEYFGGKCACCGETEPKFLTIDHMHNDGATHRKEVRSDRIARWLVNNEFPDGFQLLCYNCNCGRYRNGGICPHEKARQWAALAQNSGEAKGE